MSASHPSLTDGATRYLTTRALDAGVITNQMFPTVLHVWYEPCHVWNWFNAVTEQLKGYPALLPERTARLHGLCAGFIELSILGEAMR